MTADEPESPIKSPNGDTVKNHIFLSKKKPPPPPKKPPAIASVAQYGSSSYAVESSGSSSDTEQASTHIQHAHNNIAITQVTGGPSAHSGSVVPRNATRDDEKGVIQTVIDVNESNPETGTQDSDESDNDIDEGPLHSDLEEEAINLTAVGRIYNQDGKRLVIDEARWNPTETKGLGREFSVLVEKDGKKRERVFLASKYLQKVFGSVCKRKHYPSASITPDGISFAEPYAPLFFHYDDMMKICEAPHILDGFDEVQCQRDMAGLKYWYDKWILPEHEQIRESIKHGSVAYEDLWALYKPGDLLYGLDEFSQPRIYVIAGTSSRAGLDEVINDEEADTNVMASMFPMLGAFFNMKKRFAVEGWYVGWDAPSQVFTRQSAVRGIPGFSGTRRITDLDLYPLRFYKNGDQTAIDELLTVLEERGQFWKRLMSSSSTCMHHNGPATEMNSDPKSMGKPKAENINLNERVIADNDGWSLFGDKTNVPIQLKGLIDMFTSGTKQEASIIIGGFDEQYASYDKHPPENDFDQLQAQLCPSDIYCCAIRTMRWYQATITNLRPIEWKREAIQSLVVEDRTKKLVRGLVEEHKKSRIGEEILSDFIPNKGQGLVIVLHGPPGVGKTLTAECISEYTGKPLYSINIGELSSEQNVAARLEVIFELASRWDAVLLMDEADVVLEKRSYENMQRNGVVSVFLRMLEYYRGILFLTTNRLGTMDIAFQSRVTLAIKYNSLTPLLRRQIWLNFITRLNDSEKVAKQELRENLDDIQEWDLNGRQIRNVIQMAQSLALSENRMRGSLRFNHVEQVASETLKFQDYFDEEYRESRVKLGDMKDRGFREKRMTTQGSGAVSHSSRSNPWS